MRKYLFAGAVAGGLLLLGGVPAHADERPAPAGSGLLGGLLNPAGGINPTDGLNLESPLGGDLVDVKPGQNSPDLTGAAGSALPATDGRPVARTGLGAQPTNRTPADGPLGGAGAPAALPAADRLPLNGLLGGLPVIGGLLPDGRTPGTREAGLLDSDVPLLGGLGGLLPSATPQTLPAFDPTPDLSGMPGGGTPVDPFDPPATTPGGPAPAGTDPADDSADDPAPSGPAASDPPAAGPGDDDKRLHEEPIDDEGTQDRRTFSDGRPVAGEDDDFR